MTGAVDTTTIPSGYELCLHQGIEKKLALCQSHTTRRQALCELLLITYF